MNPPHTAHTHTLVGLFFFVSLQWSQFEGPVQTLSVVVSLKLSKSPSIASAYGGALGTVD